MQLAKDGLIAYNKDRKGKAIPRDTAKVNIPQQRHRPPKRPANNGKEMGCMLKLHTLAEWMYGFLEPAPPYGLPEEMYNDVMPSGVHRYNRYNDGL